MSIKIPPTKTLSFSLDALQINELDTFEAEIFPATRSRFIELVEDKSDDIEYGAAINCQSLKWEFECPLDWNQLGKTKFDDVKFCHVCEERVYTAYSRTELKRLTSQGSCVRVITKSLVNVMGGMGFIESPYDSKTAIDESMALIDSIIQLAEHIEQFKKRRGFYSVLKVKRLLGRLDRFEQQIDAGLRDRNSGLAKDGVSLSEQQKMDYRHKADLVLNFLRNRSDFQEKIEESEQANYFRSS